MLGFAPVLKSAGYPGCPLVRLVGTSGPSRQVPRYEVALRGLGQRGQDATRLCAGVHEFYELIARAGRFFVEKFTRILRGEGRLAGPAEGATVLGPEPRTAGPDRTPVRGFAEAPRRWSWRE